MRALRNALRESGTGESKLAGLDAEVNKRVQAGVDATEPATSEEWQAYAQGATRAADFLAGNAEVTRAKAHGFASAIVRQARERRAAALASEDTVALIGRPAALEAAAGAVSGVAGRIGPGGAEPRVPRGIVKRLGPDPNLTGTGALYRWSGDAAAMEVNPRGADLIELVSGDCQMIENRLVPLPGVEAAFRVFRRGSNAPEDIRWGAVPVAPAEAAARAVQDAAGGTSGVAGAAPLGEAASGGSDGGGKAGVAQGGPTAAQGEDGAGAAPKEAWELTDSELDRLTRPGGSAIDQAAENAAG